MVTAGLRLYHRLLRHSDVRIGGLVGSFGRFKNINSVNLDAFVAYSVNDL